MPRFRKKPIEVQAVRLTYRLTIQTLEGQVVGESGDWLITGVKGEQYPCRNDIFLQTYEPAHNDESAKALYREACPEQGHCDRQQE